MILGPLCPQCPLGPIGRNGKLLYAFYDRFMCPIVFEAALRPTCHTTHFDFDARRMGISESCVQTLGSRAPLNLPRMSITHYHQPHPYYSAERRSLGLYLETQETCYHYLLKSFHCPMETNSLGYKNA